MSKIKVMIVQPIHESGVNLLKSADFEVIYASSPDPKVVAKEIKGIDGVIVRTAPFPKEIIEEGDRLKVIGRHGVGVDNIDLEFASKKGILVINTPNVNDISVAEHTLSFILALAKRTKDMDVAVREGNFKIRDEYSAVDIEGKTLGVIGFGKIGSLVGRKCKYAFNMRILVYDPYVDEKRVEELGAELVDLPTLLRESDFVTIHVPLTPETERLIGEKELKLMKPSAFIINMARGPIWDENAVAMALKEGWIKGAGTDVFIQEPPSLDNPLLKLNNIILSPHMAALTKECVVRMATSVAQGVINILKGNIPDNVVNLSLLKKYGKI
ncbi:MAG: hydroxyacid dehydrogenase [Dictyoglomaceae bacterium]|nr:hydroxyacid dehydrogenase [Dictyoglomaceae bacterium]